MLAPATGFYGTAGLGKQEVRLAYVLNLTAIDAAMNCLEEALQQYPGEPPNFFLSILTVAYGYRIFFLIFFIWIRSQ
jgi:hypothetical protein